MKKIALITPVNTADPYNTCSIHLGPLALEAYISANSDISVRIAGSVSDVDSLEPDLVGISSVTENYGRAIEMARQIKANHQIPVIIGGMHISSCPESLDPVFDAGVIGEGEETFLELLKGYPNLDGIHGLTYRKNGTLVLNPPRKPIGDLDSLPHLRRDRWVKNLGLPVIMTSRGCPYRCSFCSSPLLWKGCRVFSPEYIITEIEDMVARYGARFIRLFDDILTLDRKRLARFVEMLRGSGLAQQVTFSCFSRANLLDREMMKLLQSGNITFVAFGLESASQKVLDSLKDRAATVADSQAVIDMACDEGLNISCSVIIGAPGETEEDLLTTFAFLSQNEKKLSEVEINPLIPYPGTPLWQMALSKGLVSTSMDWGMLKDYCFIPLFDKDRYIYLNDTMPYEKFLYYVKGFTSLHRSIAKQDLIKKYFGDMVLPAALKSLSEQEATS